MYAHGPGPWVHGPGPMGLGPTIGTGSDLLGSSNGNKKYQKLSSSDLCEGRILQWRELSGNQGMSIGARQPARPPPPGPRPPASPRHRHTDY